MIKEEEIRQVAETLKKAIPAKNQYDKPLWQGVLKLIEESDFGKKNAEVELRSPLPPGKNEIEEMMDGSFDGVQMKMLEVCNSIFHGHGSVSMAPYTGGLGTRTLTLTFEAKK